jgi:uncharacterized phage-associated protein
MKKEKITIYTISDFFLSKRALTPKKLQKLVYYAYAWFIALNNQSAEEIESVLFEEAPEAWVHGPVFPSLYAKYKGYCWHEIYSGKNRQNSMKNGLCLRLCLNCHSKEQEDSQFNDYWRKQGQLYWEENTGSREEFIKVFRRNYLE